MELLIKSFFVGSAIFSIFFFLLAWAFKSRSLVGIPARGKFLDKAWAVLKYPICT